MKLLKRLRLKKETKPKFIDEDLSVEEIHAKMIMDIDSGKEKDYYKRLSPEKQKELDRYTLNKDRPMMHMVEKRCREKHGMSAYEYYDVEHPSCID